MSMMPKPTDREKKIWPKAAIHTRWSPSADQLGVNSSLSPSVAPGSSRARTTSTMNMTTSSGRKILFAFSTPLLTPRAMVNRPKTHTSSSGMTTPRTGWAE